MIKRSILMTALCATGLMVANAAAPSRTPVPAAAVLQASAAALPGSRVEGRDAMEASIAAGLLGALSEQFGERSVEIRIHDMQIATTSIIDRQIAGTGQLQLGGQGEWLPFAFRAGYDTRSTEVLAPQLVIGADASGTSKSLPVNSQLAQALLAKVRQDIGEEFADQRIKLNFSSVRVQDASSRYQRIDAIGRADFAGEGAIKTKASALHDRKTGELLRVQYDLGTESNWATIDAPQDPRIASR